MTISVAIPTLGRDTLFHTIRSLERQTELPLEVLLINQGPADLEQRIQSPLPIRVLNQEVKGVAKARNRALTEFKGDWLMFTDDDQEVNAEWVEQLRRLVETYEQVDIIGGAVFPPVGYQPEKEYVSQMYVLGETVLTKENYLTAGPTSSVVKDIWSGNMALSRKCYERVGLFDESFGRGSGIFNVGEDTDYPLRCISQGITGLLSCRLIIYHTFGARPYSDDLIDDMVKVAAAMAWKSATDPKTVDPALAERIRPYGRKKAQIASVLGSKVFAEHDRRKKLFDDTMKILEKDWTLVNGCLRPRA